MAGYDEIASFYDVMMGDASERSRRILDALERFGTRGSSLLELGCGTGAVLAGLGDLPRVVGIDASRAMLEIAAVKVPKAQFLLGDMADFDLDEKFDVIVCVYDSINHLLSLQRWKLLFSAVARHLNADGLFVFDLNTVGRLRRLAESTPAIAEFDGCTLITDVTDLGDGRSNWDLRIFAPTSDGRYELRRVQIEELGVPLEAVQAGLADDFELVEGHDSSGDVPSDESERCYFVYRRLP